MKSTHNSIESYLESLTPERQSALNNLRTVLKSNLPSGFSEELSYGMIGFVVPHSIYPKGYHCDTKLPLPFINIASQKNFVALYHMGLYADASLLDWFMSEFPKHSKAKLDMGKSCIRFKKMEEIPLELIGQLAQKMSTDQWISKYESMLSSSKSAK
ncbi:MAG: DUF1801 domain-containing protein [Bacteroidia bacterium]|nr:DUF1801 domain-containing protein [Bacteroidia bacterium]